MHISGGSFGRQSHLHRYLVPHKRNQSLPLSNQLHNQLRPTDTLLQLRQRLRHIPQPALKHLHPWTRHEVAARELARDKVVEQPRTELLVLRHGEVGARHRDLHVRRLGLGFRPAERLGEADAQLRGLVCGGEGGEDLRAGHGAAGGGDGGEGVEDRGVGGSGGADDVGVAGGGGVVEEPACAEGCEVGVVFGVGGRVDGVAEQGGELYGHAADGGAGAPDEEGAVLLGEIGAPGETEALEEGGCQGGDGHGERGAVGEGDGGGEFGCGARVQEGVGLEGSLGVVTGADHAGEAGDAVAGGEGGHGGADGVHGPGDVCGGVSRWTGGLLMV